MKKYHQRIHEKVENSEDHLTDVYVPVYRNKDSVSGFVDIILAENVAEFAYEAIHCYLIGQILCPQLGKDIIVMSRHIALAPESGVMRESTRCDFKFEHALLEKESFYGTLVECRYFIRVEIKRSGFLRSTLSVEEDIYVRNSTLPLVPQILRMEVGVEDALQLHFTYESSVVDCASRLKGYVDFVMNHIKITHMQLEILRREQVVTEPSESVLVSTSTVGKFQIMDGDPVTGERIPIVIYLGALPQLTSTLEEKLFCVRYYLNLVLVDVNDRRYFKSCEITLYRKSVKK